MTTLRPSDPGYEAIFNKLSTPNGVVIHENQVWQSYNDPDGVFFITVDPEKTNYFDNYRRWYGPTNVPDHW